jgi:hypothetical protein
MDLLVDYFLFLLLKVLIYFHLHHRLNLQEFHYHLILHHLLLL